ncbi:LysR substrate-binding domain-containing protein [Paralcaligenes ureilyticus]|uniref:LysR family transcriptional regulator n=1 Tax=Paralcaligenes ureilyticus TaxID=627131 RepID=A0A4R3MDK6_9BURK|nr:LysR substrate-binding domain-containing protein [Paralcaligenes ureilyticus]TCT11013.1 LysR family transcriptional regulator [Paralcaligenes ureilyticus]
MNRLPPLKALLVFETVARHQNITRAASHLCLTQGAVSRQILLLEEYFGFPLFQRHARGITLTSEGESLLPTLREAFAQIEEVSTRLMRRRVELTLKVPTCAMRWIYPKVISFQAEHADIPLQVTTTLQHSVDFQRETFDAAIVYDMPVDKNLHAQLLFTEQLTPMCAPSLLDGRDAMTQEDLSRMTLLHPTRDHRDWEAWARYAGFQNIDTGSGQSFDTLDLAVNAATQGFGVAIGDCVLASEDIEMQRLVKPFDCVMPGQSYYFVYPKASANQEKLAALHSWLSRYCVDNTQAEIVAF